MSESVMPRFFSSPFQKLSTLQEFATGSHRSLFKASSPLGQTVPRFPSYGTVNSFALHFFINNSMTVTKGK